MIFHGSTFILGLHFCFTTVDAVSGTTDDGQSRRTLRAVKAPRGKCLSFELDRGSQETMIEYVCCNNCHQANQTCSNTTYGSALNSTHSYCDRCGRSGSTKNLSVPFFCGGCRNQTNANNMCRTVYNGTIPTGCWLFPLCFKYKCNFSSGTCFNGVCDAGENVAKCPADCCPQKNSKNCSLLRGTCPLKCCGEPGCCLNENEGEEEEEDDSGGGGFTLIGWIQYVGIIIAIIVIGAVVYKKCGCSEGDNEVHPTDNA